MSEARRISSRRRPSLVPWLFISPWILGFLFFTLGPMVFSLVMSLHDWPVVGERRFVGLDNYRVMLTQDPKFWQSLGVTVKFAAIFVPLNILLSFLLAVLLNVKVRGTALFRTAFYLPSIISGVALVMIWKWIYSKDYGLLNYGLSLLGVDGPNWLGDPNWSILAIIIASLWGLGGTMLILLAGLQSIPKELYEAARISGVPAWAQTVYITIPMLSPMLLFTFITSLISAFQQLTIALLLTKGGAAELHLFLRDVHLRQRLQVPRHGLCGGDELGDVPDHPDPQHAGPEILCRLGALRRRSEGRRQWLEPSPMAR